MGDRFYVQMRIGGILTRARFKQLYDYIETAGLNDENDRRIEKIEDLVENIEPGQSLGLMDCEANWDTADDLKTFCRENNLSYELTWDGNGEYDKEYNWWTPGMANEETKQLTSGGADYVEAEAVRHILAELDDEGHSPKTAIAAIRSLLPVGDPKIPPFRLITPETLGGKIIEADLLFQADRIFQEVIDGNCTTAQSS